MSDETITRCVVLDGNASSVPLDIKAGTYEVKLQNFVGDKSSLLWTPANLQGLDFWLDAQDTSTLSLTGSTVDSWTDKAGNVVGTAPVGNKPSYDASIPAVYFDQSGVDKQWLNFGDILKSTNQTGLSVMGVFRTASHTGFRRLFTKFGSPSDANEWLLTPDINQPARFLHRDANLVFSTAGNVSAPTDNLGYHIHIGLYNHITSSCSVFYDGISGTTVPVQTPSATPSTDNVYLARDLNNISVSEIYACEVLAILKPLSTYQRQQVEGYLSHKWGLTQNLSANHPYKNSPPLANLWTPSLLSSPLDFWLDAQDTSTLSLTGSTVDSWTDKAGSVTGTAPVGNKPSYDASIPAVFFDQSGSAGNEQWLNFGDILKTSSTVGISIFMVARTLGTPAAGSQFPVLFSKAGTPNSDNEWTMFRTNNNLFNGYRSTPTDNYFRSTPFSDTTNYHLFEYMYDNTASTISGWLDGVSHGTPTAITVTSATPSTDIVYLARNQSVGSAVSSEQYVCEVVVSLSPLSTYHRQQVEGYLAHKWNTTASLPADHPFKSAPPLIQATPIEVEFEDLKTTDNRNSVMLSSDTWNKQNIHYASSFVRNQLSYRLRDPTGNPVNDKYLAVFQLKKK